MKQWLSFTALCGVLIMGDVTAASRVEQKCKPSKQATTPSEDFAVMANGNIQHKKTGLIWKRCVEGQRGKQCSGDMKKYYWEELTPWLNKTRGWRLPTIEELVSITEKQCKRPSMNLSIFPNSPSIQHWSSSEVGITGQTEFGYNT